MSAHHYDNNINKKFGMSGSKNSKNSEYNNIEEEYPGLYLPQP